MKDSQLVKIITRKSHQIRSKRNQKKIDPHPVYSLKWIYLSFCYLIFFGFLFFLYKLQDVSISSIDLQITKKSLSPIIETKIVPNPTQQSKFAYTTLISGIDQTFKYRGFLYNALIMRKALQDLGSTADFIALIGFSTLDTNPFEDDMNLLRSHGIQTYILPRFVDGHHQLSFAEMALLKITPWSFENYDKVQFLDGDVMPLKNMDCFFQLSSNAFTIGAVSPLNSGWYLAIPKQTDYLEMKEKAIWRLGRDWDQENGWNEKIPSGLMVRGGIKEVTLWDFNGADMDQGLFTHYFILHHGNALLIDTDTKKVRFFPPGKGLLQEHDQSLPIDQALLCCHGKEPTRFFAHFTGRNKPWMVDFNTLNMHENKNANFLTWSKHLDALKLPIDSKNISKFSLGSPLGYWNAKFPKGGFSNR